MELSSMSSPLRGLVHLGVALALAGCGHAPLSSLIQLRRTDVATTDPGDLRAAVKLPAGLRPRETRLTLVVRPAAGGRHERSFVLRATGETPEAGLKPGERVFAYRIDPADVPRLAAFRAETMTSGADAKGRSSLEVNVSAKACREADLPDGPAPISTYLKTGETAGYVPLLRDFDLRRAEGDLLANIPPCDEPPRRGTPTGAAAAQ